MPKNLKKVYLEYLKKDTQDDKPKKCKALIRTCRECGNRFKKGEVVCSKCGVSRPKCDKWAMTGKSVCDRHGGKGGRPMTKGMVLSKNTFTNDEWKQIESAVSEKKREHEFIYQIAVMAFRKILETVDPEDPKSPMILLGAAGEYFSKICRYMNEIDSKAGELIHKYTFGPEMDYKLQKALKDISDKTIIQVVLTIAMILKQNLTQEQYEKIYSQLPPIYKEIIKNKMGQKK